MFASNTAQQGSSSSSRPALIAEDEDVEMDPEYGPKRFLTTKVYCGRYSRHQKIKQQLN